MSEGCGDNGCKYVTPSVGTNMRCRCDDCPECGMDTKRANEAMRHLRWCSRGKEERRRAGENRKSR